jgi:hypothetical protein
MVATAEVKTVLPLADPHYGHEHECHEREIKDHRAAWPRGPEPAPEGAS